MSNQNQKISHVFNLPSLNFKTQMNIAIDANAHIKTVVNVQPYMYDCDIDSINGKCNIKGKIGLKILYLDVDNVYNTITDETSFSESVTSQDLTNDCKVYLYNEQISPSIDYDEKYLRISLNVNAKLYSNIELGVNCPNTNMENLVVKKSPIEASHCIDCFKNKVGLENEITLDKRINKILGINISPNVQNIACNEGYITISGNNYIQLIYEIEQDGTSELRFHQETIPFKFETQATLCEVDCVANINLKIDNSSINFNTELNEDQTAIKLEYNSVVVGCIYKNISLDYVEDIYSTENEIEPSYSSRKICKVQPIVCFKTNIDGEINLLEETNCDEIIDLVNHSSLITNSYLENGKIVMEGVISSTLIYYNEEKDVKSMTLELPFALSKEMQGMDKTEVFNCEISPVNCKAKIKRGNVLTLDYEVVAQCYLLEKEERNLLENIKFGNIFNYGDIAFQILVAKSNETIWEFCKRAHTSHEEILKNNKEIPPIFQGGEKILIFR